MLTAYVRATVVIALTDAIGVSLIALILGLKFIVPIGVLVFIGAFIPVVGAFVSGIAAVAVALVTVGPVTALIMLGGVLAIQQIEGHVLQPFLMGRLVRVHPLAVVLVIAACRGDEQRSDGQGRDERRGATAPSSGAANGPRMVHSSPSGSAPSTHPSSHPRGFRCCRQPTHDLPAHPTYVGWWRPTGSAHLAA